jgi:hypothetical protein
VETHFLGIVVLALNVCPDGPAPNHADDTPSCGAAPVGQGLRDGGGGPRRHDGMGWQSGGRRRRDVARPRVGRRPPPPCLTSRYTAVTAGCPAAPTLAWVDPLRSATGSARRRSRPALARAPPAHGSRLPRRRSLASARPAAGGGRVGQPPREPAPRAARLTTAQARGLTRRPPEGSRLSARARHPGAHDIESAAGSRSMPPTMV